MFENIKKYLFENLIEKYTFQIQEQHKVMNYLQQTIRERDSEVKKLKEILEIEKQCLQDRYEENRLLQNKLKLNVKIATYVRTQRDYLIFMLFLLGAGSVIVYNFI